MPEHGCNQLVDGSYACRCNRPHVQQQVNGPDVVVFACFVVLFGLLSLPPSVCLYFFLFMHPLRSEIVGRYGTVGRAFSRSSVFQPDEVGSLPSDIIKYSVETAAPGAASEGAQDLGDGGGSEESTPTHSPRYLPTHVHIPRQTG